MDDLLKESFNNNISAFADDTKLYGTPGHTLQIDLDCVFSWCKINKAYLNIKKCKVLRFGNNNPNYKYIINGEELDSSETEKDLGISIDVKMTFTQHVTKVLKRSYTLINVLLRIFNKKNVRVITRLYKLYVLPVIEYGSKIYGGLSTFDSDRLEKLQKFFTRRLLGRRLGYLERLKTLGLETLKHRRSRKDIITLYKLFTQKYHASSLLPHLSIQSTKAKFGRLQVDLVRKDICKRFFFHRSIMVWNSLP